MYVLFRVSLGISYIYKELLLIYSKERKRRNHDFICMPALFIQNKQEIQYQESPECEKAMPIKNYFVSVNQILHPVIQN